MKPRETGGNVPRKRVRVTPPKPEVAVGPPKPRIVKVAPEVTRPVSPKQRKAIDRGVAKAKQNVETKRFNDRIRIALLKAQADDLEHRLNSNLTRKLFGHVKVQVEGDNLIVHQPTYFGLGHRTERVTEGPGGRPEFPDVHRVEASFTSGGAPAAKALDIAGAPGRAIGKKTEGLAKALGAPKGVQTAARLGGEFLLDPTTYATGAYGKVGIKAAESAARNAAKKATAKGLSDEQVERFAHRAAKQTLKKHPHKGVQVGFRFHVPGTNKTLDLKTSGKTSAKVLASKPVEKVTGPIRNALHETVAPDVRPTHLSPTEHEAVRGAVRDFKASRATTFRDAVKLHHAVQSAVPGVADQRRIIDAIESRSVHALPDDLRPVAENLARRFDVAYKEEAKRGLSQGRFKPQGPEDAQSYFPHVSNEQLDVGPAAKRTSKTRVEPDYARGIRKPLSTVRQETPHLFSEDVPKIAAAKTARSSERIALSDLWQEVAKSGRELKPSTHVEFDAGDAVYQVTPRGLVELGADGKPDLKAIQRVLDGKTPGRFVVMHRGAVEDVKKAIGSHGLGDTLPERVWDRTQGFLKIATTIPNPGYHTRNLLGDTSNAYLADTTTKDLARSARAMNALRKREKFKGSAAAARGETDDAVEAALHRPLNLGKSGDSTVGRELQLAEQHGAIRTGQAGAEFRDLLGGSPEKLRRLRAASEYREDFPRFATYLSARSRGMSPQDAAEWSRFHHVAYDDLTDFERRIGRRFLPFYTWFARNSRIQATKLVTRPGKFATIDKLYNEAAQAAGFKDYADYQKKNLADYQKKGLPFPIKVGNHVYNVYVGLPTTDLNQLTTNVTEQAFNIGGRLTFFKAIPEVIANYSIFFRGPIEDDHSPLVPAPDLVGDLPESLRKRLGVQKFWDKRSGKRVWGWPARVDYVARQLPQTSFLTQFGTSVAGSRGYDRKLGAISYATGAKITPADPVTTEINSLYDQRDQLQAKRDALRQRLGKQADGHYRKTAETDRLADEIAALDKRIGKLRLKRKDPIESIPLNQRTKVKSEAERAYEALTGGSNSKLQSEIDRAHKALRGGSADAESEAAFKALTGG